jgi:predicted dehydrogenase
MIRLAIVGTGSIANYHATQFKSIAGCEVVAACEVDKPRLTEFCAKHAIPHAFTDLDVLLRDCAVDAIVNSTPDRFHAPVSLKAIKQKKHVLCEKPLAVNYAEAAQMARAARRAGVVNMVHFTYRNAPVIHKAHELVASGALGHIVHVDGSYLQSWLASVSWGDWRKSPGLGWRLSTRHGSTGVLGDLGVHLIDFATYAAGPIKTVYAQFKTFTKIKGRKLGEYTLDANDTALIQVEYKNGAMGSLHTTRWATGHLNTVQLLVCGTKGAVRINLDRSREKLEITTGDDMNSAKWTELECPPVPSMGERFIRAIKTGVKEQPDFARGAEVQKVLDACFVSSKQGKRVVV